MSTYIVKNRFDDETFDNEKDARQRVTDLLVKYYSEGYFDDKVALYVIQHKDITMEQNHAKAHLENKARLAAERDLEKERQLYMELKKKFEP